MRTTTENPPSWRIQYRPERYRKPSYSSEPRGLRRWCTCCVLHQIVPEAPKSMNWDKLTQPTVFHFLNSVLRHYHNKT